MYVCTYSQQNDTTHNDTWLFDLQFQCCGLKGPENWEGNAAYACGSDDPYKACGVPDSCCSEMTEVGNDWYKLCDLQNWHTWI